MSFLSLTDKKERDRIAKEYARVTGRVKGQFQEEKIADNRAKEKLIRESAPITSALNSVVLGDPSIENNDNSIVPVLKKQTAEIKKDNEELKKQQESQSKELKEITNAIQNLPYDLSFVIDQKRDIDSTDSTDEKYEESEFKQLRDEFFDEIFNLEKGIDEYAREVIREYNFKLPSDLLKSTSNRGDIERIFYDVKDAIRRLGNSLHGRNEEENRKKWEVMKSYGKAIESVVKFKRSVENIQSESGNASNSEDSNTIESQEGEGLRVPDKSILSHQISCIYYSDPNELVERLKLLVASKNAGNNGVINEINTIIDELYKNWDLSKDDYISLNKSLFPKL